jgi:hypothetical protein
MNFQEELEKGSFVESGNGYSPEHGVDLKAPHSWLHPAIRHQGREGFPSPAASPFADRCWAGRFPRDGPTAIGLLLLRQIIQVTLDLLICKQASPAGGRCSGKVQGGHPVLSHRCE